MKRTRPTKARTSKNRRAVKGRPYRQSVRETWGNMGMKARVALVGSILAFILLVSQAGGVLRTTYHTVRPYADKVTEVLVAGWQYDRAVSELRDISEQIRRLEAKKKILAVPSKQHPRGRRLNPDDTYFLQRLYRDKKKIENLLKYIDQTQMPYAK